MNFLLKNYCWLIINFFLIIKQAIQQEDIEQKYVNSGQSIVLLCDLPSNMPDGQVRRRF